MYFYTDVYVNMQSSKSTRVMVFYVGCLGGYPAVLQIVQTKIHPKSTTMLDV
jgi:hypothetical protein